MIGEDPRDFLPRRLAGELISPAMAPAPSPDQPPVLQLLLQRAQDGYVAGSHSDGHRLAITVEGGGGSSAVSCGMGMVLEALGLPRYADVVYGSSSGSVGALYGSCGRGGLGLSAMTELMHTLERQQARRWWRRWIWDNLPPIRDLDYLFDRYLVLDPIPDQEVRSGTEFRCLAYSLEEETNVTLQGFSGWEEALRAARASASLPGTSGDAVLFRGQPYIDGAMGDNGENLCYRRALDEGCTHVLVLRSFAPTHRKKPLPRGTKRRYHLFYRDFWELVQARVEAYNREAEAMEPLLADGTVWQIAPARSYVHIFERDYNRILEAMDGGAQAAAAALGLTSATLMLQPTVRLSPEV